jgi:hypothetical protein
LRDFWVVGNGKRILASRNKESGLLLFIMEALTAFFLSGTIWVEVNLIRA